MGRIDRPLRSINREQGLTILLVEQNAHTAMALCDYDENEDVREFYLGLSLGNERRSFRDVKHYKRRKRWLGRRRRTGEQRESVPGERQVE